MHRYSAPRRIQPKISTVPRSKSEAAVFLDIYKLVIEKKRLQQELERLDRRQQQILDRLLILEAQVAELEQTAHHLREEPPVLAQRDRATAPKRPTASPSSETFDMFFLEY
jgi:chromosome segregation ATPase